MTSDMKLIKINISDTLMSEENWKNVVKKDKKSYEKVSPSDLTLRHVHFSLSKGNNPRRVTNDDRQLNYLLSHHKGLKEWEAFNALRQTIDDFNETCPLLEMMSHKAMKKRHWDRIQVSSTNSLCKIRTFMTTPLSQ